MSTETEVRTRAVGKAMVFEIEGDLDVMSLPILHDAMARAQEAGSLVLVLDLSKTHYVTSHAIGLIVKNWKELRDHGGDLRLCGVSPFIRKTLAMLGVERIIPMFGSQAEATTVR